LTPRKGVLEIVDILLEFGEPAIGDRPGRDRVQHGLDFVAGIEIGVELGETGAVETAGEGIGARLERPALEAAEAEQRVLRPADRLAELTIADDVKADLGLPAHDVGDGVFQALGVSSLVERLSCFLGGEEFAQRRRADQAADMGRENAIGAAFHLVSSRDLPRKDIAAPPKNNKRRPQGSALGFVSRCGGTWAGAPQLLDQKLGRRGARPGPAPGPPGVGRGFIGSRPSRCMRLRASLRARRIASAFSRAFFSEGFS
jgi:hypothetical protein